MPSNRLQTTASGRPATFGARTRERINTTRIVDKLEAHIDNNERTPMTQTQINAARILLDRTVPVLKQLEIRADDIRDVREIPAHALLDIIEGELDGSSTVQHIENKQKVSK